MHERRNELMNGWMKEY